MVIFHRFLGLFTRGYSIYWEEYSQLLLTPSFFRGVGLPPTSPCFTSNILAIEIVDLPIENGGSFHRFLGLFTRGWSSHDYGEYPNWQIFFRVGLPPTSPCKTHSGHPGRPSWPSPIRVWTTRRPTCSRASQMTSPRSAKVWRGWIRTTTCPRHRNSGDLHRSPNLDPMLADVGRCWMVIFMIFRIYIIYVGL